MSKRKKSSQTPAQAVQTSPQPSVEKPKLDKPSWLQTAVVVIKQIVELITSIPVLITALGSLIVAIVALLNKFLSLEGAVAVIVVAIVISVLFLIIRRLHPPWPHVSLVLNLVLVVLVLVIVWRFTTPPRTPDPSTYGFETGTMGWTPSQSPGANGIISAIRSNKRVKLGQYALETSMDIARGQSGKAQSGEIYVQLVTPHSMEGITITAWVYAPKGAAGDPNSPNGFQLFVKDSKYRYHYSAWANIAGYEDEWLQLMLKPGVAEGEDIIDPDFDVKQIKLLGIKISIGEKAKTGTAYRGPIYIDAIKIGDK